ncbi:hypothetical protein KBB59_02890 [Candidatus Woesebacteria bacterium]|jgi:hypothetical protein|nr:hypothetical protein [Candidatus Woesebacteria bacterium]HNV44862.1 hypothetical protein [Candidatus Woesebacteria bacterium]HOA12225.1 hypothetical protein [Candidatus Woesebacteria bacterium]HOC07377.1 hypothetical protein [Candidatus Woesebacteria bacterium]HOP39040.1 hypothetical protein [Candidatus Woesebacteria bacterium]
MSNSKKIKKIGLGLFLTCALFFGALQLSKALFSDVETLSNNTAGAASVNLKLAGQDPTQYSFSVPNLIPGETAGTAVAVTDIGTGADFNENLYIGLVVTESGEGVNTEAETDIEGVGELADCLMMRVSYLDMANHEVEVQPYTSFTQLQTMFIDEQNFSPLDDLLQTTTVNLKLDFNADACGNEAMGDTVAFDLNFYYEQ